jgi:uncharacterized protein (DUF1778 family)
MPTQLQRISVYLTAGEKAQIQKNAQKYGLTVSSFLTFTGSRDALPMLEAERNLYLDLIQELKRTGNNLNQIARAMNAARLSDTAPPIAEDIDRAIQEYKDAVKAITEKL